MMDLATNFYAQNAIGLTKLAIDAALENKTRTFGRAVGSAAIAGLINRVGGKGRPRGKTLRRAMSTMTAGMAFANFTATQYHGAMQMIYDLDNAILDAGGDIGELSSDVIAAVAYAGAGGLDMDYNMETNTLTIGADLGGSDERITFQTELFSEETSDRSARSCASSRISAGC